MDLFHALVFMCLTMAPEPVKKPELLGCINRAVECAGNKQHSGRICTRIIQRFYVPKTDQS